MTADQKIIGVDESGKGDFFGPLVIGAVLARSSDEERLRALGVRDSKKISDNRILQIDHDLRAQFVVQTVVYVPSEYNRRYKAIKNLNILLAGGHADAIAGILKQESADLAISDKFGKDSRLEDALDERGMTIRLKQIVRGESAALQVAAASIVARAEFIRQMKSLGEEVGVDLPKGASSLVDQAASKIVSEFGMDTLEKLVKVHFKNYPRVVALASRLI